MREKAAERVFRVRTVLGLTQREFARELNVSPGAIALWETGVRQIPGPVTRLLELYESRFLLDEEKSRNQSLESMRTLVREWSEALLPTADLREQFERSTEVYLDERVAETGPIAQRVKLALARRAAKYLADSKGLPLKVAQLASYLDTGIPEPIREVLGHAVAQSRPKPEGLVAKAIFEELGDHPNRIFAEWNPKPLAVASIGQVHLARLKTGERVAVKVQHQGIERNLARHLRAMPFLNFLISVIPKEDRGIFEEVGSTILAECDYSLEAEHQEKFRSIFKDDPGISVPRVFPEWSTKRILITEYAAGISLREFVASAPQEEKSRAGEAIVRFHSTAIFRHGLQHADPHPANYIFAGGKVHFVDYGRINRYSPAELDSIRRLYLAILHGNPRSARIELEAQHAVRDWASFDFDEFWSLLLVQQRHHRTEGVFEFTPEYVEEISRAARRFPQKSQLRINRHSLWSLCVNSSLCSVLAELRAKSDWRSSALSVLGATPAATENRIPR